MKRLNHLELFAGIGGFSRAAELLYIDSGLEIPTIAYSEIDKHAVKTYQAIHPSSKYSLAMGDLIAWNKTKDYITRNLTQTITQSHLEELHLLSHLSYKDLQDTM